MNRKNPEKELQQLSTYLDGQLPEKERIQFEARLQSTPELRDELEGLRRTQMLLRQAPKRRAPRNFFITPEMAPKRRAPVLFPVFRMASALAGLLLVVAFAGDLLFGFAPLSAAPLTAPMTLQSQERTSSGAYDSSNAQVFTWATPTPGGLSGIGPGSGGGGTVLGMGGGPPSGDTLAPTTPVDNSVTTAPPPESTAEPGLAAAPITATEVSGTPPSLMSVAPLNSQPAATEALAAKNPYQSGPVMGINPTEGAADATQVAVFNQAQSQPIQLPRPVLHIVEGGLGLLVVLAGLAAFFFHRRESL